MQEIKKRRIVIASVLKPVNDPRMFEKMALALAHQYEVHIFGIKTATVPKNDSVFFHSFFSFQRVSLNRLLAPFKILRKILTLKPSLLIICTHELLWMVLLVKMLVRCRVIYDIRENYFRNILYTNAFPPVLRVFVALYVRCKEWITAPFIDRFFLAEAGYACELSFIDDRAVVIENKVKKIELPHVNKWSAADGNTHLLFSGTLAPTTGIFTAIDLAKKLYKADARIRLHIIGFSPMHSVRQEIRGAVDGHSFIKFMEYSHPVQHTEILLAIQKADVGIIAYPPNRSTVNTIPTKLYEYLGYSLPIFLIDHPVWTEMCQPYPAAVNFDPDNLNVSAMLQTLRATRFYKIPADTTFWESEEKKLLQSIDEEINKNS
jgi:glycosyltransferase involved in cell wall biosynthesis